MRLERRVVVRTDDPETDRKTAFIIWWGRDTVLVVMESTGRRLYLSPGSVTAE